MSKNKRIEAEELAALWSEIEVRLDSEISEEKTAIAFDNEDPLRHYELFDQGIAAVAPDMLDRIAEPEPDLPHGALLSRYRIIRQLGSGGMGEVYLAERADGQVNMRVALKILSNGLVDPVFLARFQRERQILAELNHPGIASLLDAGITDQGRPWFVLNYIQGEPVNDYCKHQSLTLVERLALFQKLCEAIEYAHQWGVVHRDLKPGNILIDEASGKPVVLDFGIATKCEDDNLTRTGQMLGTVFYSSPEQIRGEVADLDLRSDIFSLGILLYELVDNRKPFESNNLTETSYQIIYQDTPALHTKQVPQDLSAIIFKCLNKSPSDRYQLVSELIADLQNFKQGRSVTAHPVGPVYMLSRWVRRRPYLSTAILLTSLMITGLTGATIWQSWSKQEFAARQALITQHFDQVAQEIESGAQLVYSRPLHNIENALAGFEQKYKNLKLEAGSVNSASLPFVNYALGRAALGMGYNQEALQFLKIAWEAGFRDPLLALSLGQAYMHNFADAIFQISLMQYSQTQTRALEAAQQKFLLPAKQYLQTGASAKHEKALIARAILLHINKDTASALKLLNEAAERSSWPVLAMIERGNLYLEIAEEKILEGNRASAHEAITHAEKMFTDATNIARSHPDSLKGWCIARTRKLQLRNLEQPEQSAIMMKLIEPCDSLIVLRPRSASAYVQTGLAYMSVARHMRNQGDDPKTYLDKAADFTRSALQISPAHSKALRLSGSIHLTRALWVYETGGDGSELLAAAISAFDKATEMTPGDNELIEELARALHRAGKVEYNNGGDGDAAYEKSIELLRRIIAQPGSRISSELLLARVLTWQAYFQFNKGIDAENLLQEAARIARRVIEKFPEQVQAMDELAMALATHAELLFLKGENPGTVAGESFNYYQKIIQQKPENHVHRFNQLYPFSLAIDYSLDHGVAQHQALKQMNHLILELQQRLDNAHESNLLWADYLRYRAKQQELDGDAPDIEINTARSLLKKALESKIDRYEAIQSFAALVVFDHSRRERSGRKDLTLYQSDYRVLSEMIDQYPDLPTLRLWRSRLVLLSESLDEKQKQQAANDDYSLALQLNPLMGNRPTVFYKSVNVPRLQ